MAKLPNTQRIKLRQFFFIKKKNAKNIVTMEIYKKSWKETLNNNDSACQGSVKNRRATLVMIARIIIRINKRVKEIEKNNGTGFKGFHDVLKMNFFPANDNNARMVNVKKKKAE